MGTVNGQKVKKEHINLPDGFIIPETKDLSAAGFFQITISLVAIVIVCVGAKISFDPQTPAILLPLYYSVICFFSIIFFLFAVSSADNNGDVHNQLFYLHHRYMIGVTRCAGDRSLYCASVFLIILGLVCGGRCIVELLGEETGHLEKLN
jgi:hypothetical protein